MPRRVVVWLAPLALGILIAACGTGTSTSTPTSPSTPAPSPSPTPSPSPGPSSPSPSPAPAPASCTATVTGLPSAVASQTARYPFAIAIASNCPWTARTDVSWADVAPGSGDGNATPMLNVNENTTFFTRTATVTVNGQSFQTTQSMANCVFTLDRTTLDENFDGGTAMVMVTTGDGCGWTATASESWVRVLTPSGTGTTRIFLELAPNTGDVRHAFVTIAGQRVDITQRRRG